MLKRLLRPQRFRPIRTLTHAASVSAQSEALDDAILIQAAQKPAPIRLNELLSSAPTPGEPPSSEKLLLHADYVLKQLKIRLARRLDRLRELPLIVMLNPHISEIYDVYHRSFAAVTSLKPPKTSAENNELVLVLQELVQSHAETIPTLAQGFNQSVGILGEEPVNKALWEHLKARIGALLLAEHHIGLTKPLGPSFVGCVQTDLCPSTMCEKIEKIVAQLTNVQFGFNPKVRVDVGRDISLAYVPSHLEYILTELLKNAFRAQCMLGEHVAETSPVTVTVIKSGQGVIIRIRDRGGGIRPENELDVFKFAYTTVNRDQSGIIEGEDSSLAGLGFGLPLSKAYAEFFGGSLQLQSYHGWGTDAYLTLKTQT